MASDRDDELARTATAPVGSASTPSTPAAPLASTLGRYRIEKELGAGGMGVVHAAFDPDLERRVALKVLRADDVDDEARKRLLREARAMARLAHPNVITVHEVGSADGRDFVAMELVDGETLADWLRGGRRDPDEIIAAFVAAGRGLAAAHKGGIVHRDFKPHNVLRHRDGRIAVTDFGLAREAHDVGVADPLAVTKVGKRGGTGSTSTPLSGLTETGSVLGTPAYMAPEQWSGGAVTPATDQFAYSVALWEALAGERPFRAPTVETLREAVQRGPAQLDDSMIPRRLRAVLRRGLDPDPKRRWPSMNDMLDAMTKAKRPYVALAIGSGAVVAATVVYAMSGSDGPSSVPITTEADTCPKVSIGLSFPNGAARPEYALLAADYAAWNDAHDRACKLEPRARVPVLECLDGVLARLAVVAEGMAQLPTDAEPVDPGAYLIAPTVCSQPALPRLTPKSSPQLRAVLIALIREQGSRAPTSDAVIADLVKRAGDEPCAAAWAHLAAASSDAVKQTADRDRHHGEAEQAAQACSDDRVRAEVALALAKHSLASGFLGTAISAKLKLATVAVARVSQPDLVAEIDLLRMEVASRADNIDEAILRSDAAVAGFAARGRTSAQIRTALGTLEYRELRGTPEDLVAFAREPAKLRALAVKQLGKDHPDIASIDALGAWRAFIAGDVAGAYSQFQKVRAKPRPFATPRKIRGVVVDETGKPVVGATVSAARGLVGGSPAAVIPLDGAGLRSTTTAADGTFAIDDGPDYGVIIAELGTKRSMPLAIADEVKLAVMPTSRVEGRIDLKGIPAAKVIVSAQDSRFGFTTRYELITPVAADGSFSLDGVPRTKVRVFAVVRGATSKSIASVTIDVTAPVVKNVAVAVSNKSRVVNVVVRSTVGEPVGNAQVFVYPGIRKSMTGDKIDLATDVATVMNARQIELEKAPPAVVKQARAGDLFATMRDVPEGVASACAVGLPNDLADPTLDKKIRANIAKIEMRCVPIPAGAEAVVVEVPPWPRLD